MTWQAVSTQNIPVVEIIILHQSSPPPPYPPSNSCSLSSTLPWPLPTTIRLLLTSRACFSPPLCRCCLCTCSQAIIPWSWAHALSFINHRRCWRRCGPRPHQRSCCCLPPWLPHNFGRVRWVSDPSGGWPSNLIQAIRDLGVEFFGTFKNYFPFYFIEINENKKPSINGRAVKQLYGMYSLRTVTHGTQRRIMMLFRQAHFVMVREMCALHFFAQAFLWPLSVTSLSAKQRHLSFPVFRTTLLRPHFQRG